LRGQDFFEQFADQRPSFAILGVSGVQEIGRQRGLVKNRFPAGSATGRWLPDRDDRAGR
jgi:hypothetical protein